MQSNRLLSISLLLPLLAPAIASALEVEIQGSRLEPQLTGASCVDIAGDYPGIRIEPSEAGKTPRICYNSAKVNSITIINTTFVAKDPVKRDVILRFKHDFPAGINGKVMARAKLQGFFSTSNGVGIPTGDKLSLTAFFSQTGHDDVIADPFNLTVGDQIDSALIEYSAKEQYLIAGTRGLKGELKVSFNAPGHKLTLPDKSAVSIDTGTTFEDKLETMEVLEGEESPVPKPAEGTPVGEAPRSTEPAAAPIPLPAPAEPAAGQP